MQVYCTYDEQCLYCDVRERDIVNGNRYVYERTRKTGPVALRRNE